MITEQSLTIDGPAGIIEACLIFDDHQTKRVGIICHPHPLYGGNMHDPVLGAVRTALLQNGIACLYFNFRGVGSSQGPHDQGVGETADVLFLLNWLQQEKGFNEFILGGYSFGAVVALYAAAQSEQTIERLLMVAPPMGMTIDAGHMPTSSDIGCPMTIVAGGNDDIASVSSIADWVKSSTGQCELIELTNADHFFAGSLDEISELLASKLA